jgi:YgiT-type zinc finger domain-containing protein
MSITCDLCGKKTARTQFVTRNYGRKDNLLIIEDVPVVTCSNCGESYLTADTLHEIERIRFHRRSFAKKRSVAVAAYA